MKMSVALESKNFIDYKIADLLLACDNVMTFQKRLVDHILPDQIHILNVLSLLPGMKQDYGGCAGNIA